MLSEMDGFDDQSSVIVMAATNRRDILDPALIRPGRFDRTVYVGVPDFTGRIEVLNVRLVELLTSLLGLHWLLSSLQVLFQFFFQCFFGSHCQGGY